MLGYEELEVSWRNMPSEIWIAETNTKSKKTWPPEENKPLEEVEEL